MSALKQAEMSFNALTAEERTEFTKYVSTHNSSSSQPRLNHEAAIAAWEKMKQIAAELAERTRRGTSSLEVLTEMRDSRDLTLRAFAGDETAKDKLMMRSPE